MMTQNIHRARHRVGGNVGGAFEDKQPGLETKSRDLLKQPEKLTFGTGIGVQKLVYDKQYWFFRLHSLASTLFCVDLLPHLLPARDYLYRAHWVKTAGF